MKSGKNKIHQVKDSQAQSNLKNIPLDIQSIILNELLDNKSRGALSSTCTLFYFETKNQRIKDRLIHSLNRLDSKLKEIEEALDPVAKITFFENAGYILICSPIVTEPADQHLEKLRMDRLINRELPVIRNQLLCIISTVSAYAKQCIVIDNHFNEKLADVRKRFENRFTRFSPSEHDKSDRKLEEDISDDEQSRSHPHRAPKCSLV